jgi:hypothetical protein
MRLERLGCFHPTRLSFMRSLLRRMAREHWRFERQRFDIDETGEGVAVYAVHIPAARAPARSVRLVAFGHAIADHQRTDRVIAERWDATFVLTSAEADDRTIARLAANVPRQEAGRCSAAEFVLSRANKSMRLFGPVVESLAAGRQPDPRSLLEVGYLMRTTAVYGNGKFGLSDLANTFAQGLFSRPFEAEMLIVYLIREFTFDLAEHLARTRSPATAVRLSPDAKHMLGIGNATGLGMAPFLCSHPQLIGRWIDARETALARVCGLERADPDAIARFMELFDRAVRHLAQWETSDPRQHARIEVLCDEIPAFGRWLLDGGRDLLAAPYGWARLAEEAARRLSPEGQELINSLMLEPHGALVDDLEDGLAVEEGLHVDPVMSLAGLRALIERAYGWALERDYEAPGAQHFFWYVSEEKLEPRLGERGLDPGADKELPIGVGRDVKRLYEVLVPLAAKSPDMTVAELQLARPDLRRILARVQSLAPQPYAEIRDNLLGRDLVAVDLLRCKLATFGASKFDPKSDRWTRINMYQGAPGFDELNVENSDDWAFPAFTVGPAPGVVGP